MLPIYGCVFCSLPLLFVYLRMHIRVCLQNQKSIAGVLFDLVRILRTTLLLRTTLGRAASGGRRAPLAVSQTPYEILSFLRQSCFCVFLVLVFDAATQLTLQLHQERIQMMRNNKVVRRILTKSNGTHGMNLEFEDIRIRRYTNKRGRNKKRHIHKHATCTTSTHQKKEPVFHLILFI